MHESRWDCLKYYKSWCNRAEGREHKDFKMGGKLGQGVGALKRRGLEPPCELCGLVLTLWCIGFGLEKYLGYLTGLEMILYVGISFEKYLNYLTGFGLTVSCLWYIGYGLEKQSALGLPHWTWIVFIEHWAWIN